MFDEYEVFFAWLPTRSALEMDYRKKVFADWKSALACYNGKPDIPKDKVLESKWIRRTHTDAQTGKLEFELGVNWSPETGERYFPLYRRLEHGEEGK